VGTGMGGTTSMDGGYKTLYGDNSDRIKPFTILMGMHNAAAAWIGMAHACRARR
jgi:3-oxoacyl-[acyl-carrier-protein] synthase II